MSIRRHRPRYAGSLAGDLTLERARSRYRAVTGYNEPALHTASCAGPWSGRLAGRGRGTGNAVGGVTCLASSNLARSATTSGRSWTSSPHVSY